MPFKPGEGGRQRGAKNHATRDVHLAFAKLGGPNGKFYAKQLHDLACGQHSDPHVRIKALAIIAPYVWGKPKEHIAVTGPDGGAIEIHHHFAA